MARQSTPPCRLRVILARKAPVGVIFRRSPSKWGQLIKWNAREDSFEEGQWFHGHIYEGRSDLSPSGDLLIYFASKFNKKTVKDMEYTYAWTAIGWPPYLTALALWPKGACWHGGGLFIDERRLFLNHRPEAPEPHPDHRPKGIRVKANPKAHGEDDPVLLARLTRDGWKFLQWLDYDYFERRTIRPVIFEKKFPSGNGKLHVEKYIDRMEELWICSLITKQGNAFSIGIGTWVDFDQAGRITFADDGKLFAVKLSNGKVVLTERNLKPPDWVTPW